MSTVETNYTAHLNPKELKEFEGNLQEITDAMTRADGEAELITEICKQAKDKYGIESKDVRKIATMRHKRSRDEEEAKAERVFTLYDQIYGEE